MEVKTASQLRSSCAKRHFSLFSSDRGAKNLQSILRSEARCMRRGQRRSRLHISPFLTCGIDVAGGGGGGVATG